MNIKTKLKKILPGWIDLLITYYLHNKIITNFFNTKHSKNVLISYILTPFRKDSLTHTNYFEAISWAMILSELGYNVDIINYYATRKRILAKYDLICGFGNIFQQYFENGKQKKIDTIFYGTGMHVCHQNLVTLNRLKSVYLKKGVWLGKSARYVENTWTYQTTLVDGIIALGNDVCAKSYQKYYDGSVYSVPAPFYITQNALEIILKRKQNSQKSFLWFGSAGLIHKGLDLLLDFFVNHPDLTLHICGPLDSEPDFVLAYHEELYNYNNIKLHGFVNINSKIFFDILVLCDFIIFPSCSEGGSPSVLTAIGNGALIPIITKEATISTGFEIWIEEFTTNAIEEAVGKALALGKEEVISLQKKNFEFVILNNSQNAYYNQLKNTIETILDKSN